MSALDVLLATHTSLGQEDAEHLQALVGEWQLLADLSFADLLLWVRTKQGKFLCVAQVRPTTGPTAYQRDLIEAGADADYSATLDDPDSPDRFRVRRTPDGPVIAVITRRRQLPIPAAPSALEIAYTEAATSLLGMVEHATFPPSEAATEMITGPRAGDGLVLMHEDGRVRYASPNAISAYRRMGWNNDLADVDLAQVTRSVVHDRFHADDLVARMTSALEGRSPLRLEVDAGGGTVLFRALPLEHRHGDAGALILLRDVTDVRRRDRQLLSKDATIREIHHRVKNNLQTVAALLRLQARRVDVPAVRSALTESVRRVSSIALVHETLSMSLDERVDFDGIVDRLIPMVAEVAAPESTVQIVRVDNFGVLPADVATPLVLVVVEILQNAVEHAFAPHEQGTVTVEAHRRPGTLQVRITDDGSGLPDGFDLRASDRLGLQIVQTLVESELEGTISVSSAGAGRGTIAVLEVPLTRR
ncbi:sensor histidine kinase [Cumulibacter manganitolerans]|uniref:sensor histidine kinase n=1 Tax=Cumulibacter manganitolerans TaxID=1884992 RepID=UPI0012964260|nr:PAS domain-containing sensor histidine kinase [Cumulibacter manganitolerans]